jgi:hypothetical protein
MCPKLLSMWSSRNLMLSSSNVMVKRIVENSPKVNKKAKNS